MDLENLKRRLQGASGEEALQLKLKLENELSKYIQSLKDDVEGLSNTIADLRESSSIFETTYEESRRQPLSSLPVALSGNGEFLAIGDERGVVRVFDIDNQTQLAEIRRTGPVGSISIDDRAASIAIGQHKSALVEIWNRVTQSIGATVPRRLGDPNLEPDIPKLSLSGDGRLLAVSDHGQHVRIYDTETGKSIYEVPDPRIYSIALDLDGGRLASASYGITSGESVVQVWNIELSSVIFRQIIGDTVDDLAFGSNGLLALSKVELGSELLLWTWDPIVLQELAEWRMRKSRSISR